MACIKKTSVFSVIIFSVFESVCEVLSCNTDYQYSASGKSCCKGEWKTGDCVEDLAGWLIATVVLLVLSFTFLIGACIYRCYYKPCMETTYPCWCYCSASFKLSFMYFNSISRQEQLFSFVTIN